MAYRQGNLLILAVLCSFILAISFSSNPPNGRTGAPGEASCNTPGCHFNVNPLIDGEIFIEGISNPISRDSLYNLKVSIIRTSGNPLRGGFQSVVLTGSEQNAGSFQNPGPSSTISDFSERIYWDHSPARNFNNSDTVTYLVEWLANFPEVVDHVIFYTSAVLANGNGGNTGDRTKMSTDTFRFANESLKIRADVQSNICANDSSGMLTIEIISGQEPFEYLWNTEDSSASISDLPNGFYSVTVKDLNSSVTLDSIQISNKDTILPQINCFSDTFKISSCAPFNYPLPLITDNCSEVTLSLIAGRGSNQSFVPGIHKEIYEGIDDSGNAARCTITVVNEVNIETILTIDPINCHQDSIGSIQIEISGTNPPFEISIDPDKFSLDSIPEGTYTLTVIDNSGCTDTLEVNFVRPDSISITIDDITPAQNSNSGDGAINISVDGGTPPYNFLWRTENEDFSEEEDLELLFPGVYQLEITDANGCTAYIDSIRVDAITSSYQEIKSTVITVFPNPTTRELIIEPSDLQLDSYVILRSDGSTLKRGNIDHYKIDISEFNNGIYIIVLTLKSGEIINQKFVKN